MSLAVAAVPGQARTGHCDADGTALQRNGLQVQLGMDGLADRMSARADGAADQRHHRTLRSFIEDVWGHFDDGHTRPGTSLYPSERKNTDELLVPGAGSATTPPVRGQDSPSRSA